MTAQVEKPLIFQSGAVQLIGILHQGEGAPRDEGIVIVVGGPQYRVGSHRQFVLMARALAAAGFDVLRFDYQGMGDSEGRYVGFEGCDEDIRAAIDILFRERPALRSVALLGLCDGASAAMMYAPGDQRVRGLILANPWARTEGTQAATYLRHYYLKRLFEPSFWMKLLSGGLRMRESLAGLGDNVRQARGGQANVGASFVVRMREGLRAFHGRVLLLLSEQDLTAREFDDLFSKDAHWRRACRNVALTREDLAGADHTFSERASLSRAVDACVRWSKAQVRTG